MKSLNPILISGKEVLPLVEGGKGINGSDGRSSGAWAHENCVGTFSGVSPDFYDDKGNVVIEKFLKRSRPERHEEMVERAIKGGIAQAQVAHEVSGGNGRIHMNMLWELADSQRILEGVLEKAKGLINGITCGAGMPYHLGALASKFGVYYYPIVSSARAFNILWKRAYSNFTEFLGGVVYEDPWLAGGHNGLSNAEDPTKPETPYNRVAELRRPMITKESPISEAWKKVMLHVKKGDVILQRFSPTGFFSSAIKNSFLAKLIDRKNGEIAFKTKADAEFSQPLKISDHKTVFIKPDDMAKANNQINAGLTSIKETPDQTVVFMTPEDWEQMKEDRKNCVGCLSQCQFSTWSAVSPTGSTGRIPDPRTYCIHKTLYEVGHGGSVKDHLLFAGHQVYRFATDPLYRNGCIPSVKELIEKIKRGE